MLNWLKSVQSAPKLGDMMRPEDNSFGVMRLLMAVAVLISHSYLFQYGTSAGEPLTAWTGRSLGEHGVQVFFILSGLMVAQSFERSRGVIDFTTARILRIFPALIVCVLLTALVLGPIVTRMNISDYLTDAQFPAYILKTISLATGSAPLPGVFETNPLDGRVNTSLWTLKYEVICYLALGIAGVAGLFSTTWRRPIAALTAAFIAFVFVVSPEDHQAYGLFDTVRYFAVFFATGVLAYLIRDKLVVHGAPLLALFLLFVVAIDTAFAEPAAALFLGYGAIWLSTFSFGPLRAFCNRYDLSFGIYIYAGPLQQAMIERWQDLSPAGVSMLAMLAVVPLAYLSWTLVEKPAMNQRRSVSDAVRSVVDRAKNWVSSRRPLPQVAQRTVFGLRDIAVHSREVTPQRARRPRLHVS